MNDSFSFRKAASPGITKLTGAALHPPGRARYPSPVPTAVLVHYLTLEQCGPGFPFSVSVVGWKGDARFLEKEADFTWVPV